MKKILWFVTWYPSEKDPYTGDFIQRHALAAAPFVQLDLLHVVKSVSPKTGRRESIGSLPGGGRATIIYYSGRLKWFPALHRALSFFTYLRIHRQYLEKYIAEKGMPDGIHVHVAYPGGVAAWLAHRRFGLPYIVSEHWTGLCPEASVNFDELGFFKKWLWKKIMQGAVAHTAVSGYLAAQMKARFFPSTQGRSMRREISVIPNVVDGKVFFPAAFPEKRQQFIHISNFTNQKNLKEIIRAAAVLKEKWPSFLILFIGGNGEPYRELVQSLQLESQVTFLDAMPQGRLRPHIQDSAALILYSLYETFGCVVIEANACGKPAITADLPVFRENVFSGRNGMLVPLHEPARLAAAMFSILSTPSLFDPQEIRRFALENYSLEKIGLQFSDLYDEVLARR